MATFLSFHTFLYSVPAKVIKHAIFCTGHFKVGGRGDTFSLPFIQLDITGLLSTQEAYNQLKSENDEINAKSVKIDYDEVQVHIWNTCLFKTHPKPETILGFDENCLWVTKHLDALQKFALL